MSTETDTPRCDAVDYSYTGSRVQMANLARDLERELAAACELGASREAECARLRAALIAFEQLIDRPVVESGGYHYSVANAPAEFVSEVRALIG